jgi:hypothetical protein
MTGVATMVAENLDQLIYDRLIPFRERIIKKVSEKHPQIMHMVNAMLTGRENKVGLQVMENGRVAGEYTFHLSGINITRTDAGKLDSGLHHPFLGLIKPYIAVERSTLEAIIADEASIGADPLAAVARHLPGVTFKFMR